MALAKLKKPAEPQVVVSGQPRSARREQKEHWQWTPPVARPREDSPERSREEQRDEHDGKRVGGPRAGREAEGEAAGQSPARLLTAFVEAPQEKNAPP